MEKSPSRDTVYNTIIFQEVLSRYDVPYSDRFCPVRGCVASSGYILHQILGSITTDMSSSILGYDTPFAFIMRDTDMSSLFWNVLSNRDMSSTIGICHALLGYVMSLLDMSCPFPICHVLSWYAMPFPDIPCPLPICHALSRYAMVYPDMSLLKQYSVL